MSDVVQKRRRLIAGLALSPVTGVMPAVAWAADELPEKIQKQGVLKVAVYKDFAPFHDKGAGIDVDIAQRVAERLGLKMTLLPFDADENINDDLRNMVWKGHYMGYGPADVMIHVPVDRAVMEQNPQVLVFAPYHRETLKLVRDAQAVPSYDSLSSLAGKKIGVEGTGLAALLLVSIESGKYRDQIAVFKSTFEALDAMRRGEVAAVIGQASELESAVRVDNRYPLSDAPFEGPARRGWAVGFSVKKDQEALARVIQRAINEMLSSGEMIKIFAKHGVALRSA